MGRHIRIALQNGVSLTTIIKELALLARGPGRIHPREYFYYRLYEPALSLSDKYKYLGANGRVRIHRAVNDPKWEANMNDKLIFGASLSGLDVATPEILALYHPVRCHGQATALRNLSDLRAFLSRSDIFPVFGKPADGMYSVGCYALDAYDPSSKKLHFVDGSDCLDEEFASYISVLSDAGYVFQKHIQQHEALVALCGKAVATVRFILCLTDDGPKLMNASIKIPANGNVADNFVRSGNLVAAVDLKTGKITRVATGYGADHVELSTHPDTGNSLRGRRLPWWEEAKAICLESAAAFPGIRVQSWDVAFTPDGPLIVEANAFGGFGPPQLAHGRGLLDDEFLECLQNLGFRA